jgi:DHA2 family multidrug resistance protein
VLIVGRACQGLCAGALFPVAQAVLLDAFPARGRGLAMAALAFVVALASVLGQPLGGWMTANFDWRWVFFLEAMLGLPALGLGWLLVPAPPVVARPGGIDVPGLGLLLVGMSGLEVVFAAGPTEGAAAPWIVPLAVLAAVTLLTAALWELHYPAPVLRVRLLRDAQLLLCSILAFFAFALTAGGGLLLDRVRQFWPAASEPLSLGIGLLPLPFLVGILLACRVEARWLLLVGLLALAAGFFGMRYPDGPAAGVTAALLAWQAGGLVLVVTLSTAAFTTTASEDTDQATALFNTFSNLGATFGAALLTTLLAWRTQTHLPAHLTGQFEEVGRLQAEAVACWDLSWLLFVGALALLPPALLLSRAR